MPSLQTRPIAVVGRIAVIAQHLERETAAALAPFDLNYSDFDVLATLRRSGEPFTLAPRELMQSVVLTSGAVTVLLGRLEKRGLIIRKPDPNDGRSILSALTPAGKELVEHAIKARFEAAQRAACVLSAQDFDQLASLLKSFAQSLSKTD